MAALGQLIAGVAHEINTPLGAIQLAVDNLSTFLTQTLTQLPPFFRSLSEVEYQDFLALLLKAFQNTEETTLSFKEQRRLKRALVHRLEEQGIDNATNLVDTLIEIGVYEDIDRFIPLLTGLDHKTILNIAYKLASLQQSTQSIASSSKRAAKVVFALKSFARFDSVGEKVEANIIEGIETVLTLYHSQLKYGVEVKRYYDVVPPVLCYPDELNQVWTNLIHNALQAMDYQGTLSIVVKKANNQVVISVTDTGTGIQEEIKQKILPILSARYLTVSRTGLFRWRSQTLVNRPVSSHLWSWAVKVAWSRPCQLTRIMPLSTRTWMLPGNSQFRNTF